jgi:hypothetical protein
MLEQGRFPGTKEPGDDGDGNSGAALAFLPAAERAGVR